MKALKGFESTICGVRYVVNVGDEIPPRVAAHWKAVNLMGKMQVSGIIPAAIEKNDGATQKK